MNLKQTMNIPFYITMQIKTLTLYYAMYGCWCLQGWDKQILQKLYTRNIISRIRCYGVAALPGNSCCNWWKPSFRRSDTLEWNSAAVWTTNSETTKVYKQANAKLTTPRSAGMPKLMAHWWVRWVTTLRNKLHSRRRGMTVRKQI